MVININIVIHTISGQSPNEPQRRNSNSLPQSPVAWPIRPHLLQARHVSLSCPHWWQRRQYNVRGSERFTPVEDLFLLTPVLMIAGRAWSTTWQSNENA